MDHYNFILAGEYIQVDLTNNFMLQIKLRFQVLCYLFVKASKKITKIKTSKKDQIKTKTRLQSNNYLRLWTIKIPSRLRILWSKGALSKQRSEHFCSGIKEMENSFVTFFQFNFRAERILTISMAFKSRLNQIQRICKFTLTSIRFDVVHRKAAQ